MAVFRKFKGPNIKYSHHDPQKGTSLPGTTPFDVFRVNIRPGVQAVALLKNPKKTNKKLVIPKARQNHVLGEQKPMNRSLQNCACRVPSWT